MLCCFANYRAKNFCTTHRDMESCVNNLAVPSFEQEIYIPAVTRVHVPQTNATLMHRGLQEVS